MNYGTLNRISFCTLALCIFLGGALYKVKHNVIHLEKDLRTTESEIQHAKESIHLLKAEWVYLNNPKKLQELNEKYLKLKPSDAIQITSIKSVTARSRIDEKNRIIMLASLPQRK